MLTMSNYQTKIDKESYIIDQKSNDFDYSSDGESVRQKAVSMYYLNENPNKPYLKNHYLSLQFQFYFL